ncbi:hypothetical protein [Microvirga sp. BSC39]|uniref:hypothetical protein n=1 Tax=Microvirga sp. BSC39 TaxID=1549810 RepID=UPI0004E86310|nr:hypothetical protein [Microvirga sp. BSC39]KFG69305.1 hypothetical protein JH26_10705 [Microvirga sp. BSC39]
MPKASFNAYSLYSSELYDVIREVLHRIGDIDYQHDAELNKLGAALSDEAVKNYIKNKIRLVHQKERQPYVDLLASLRLEQQS